MCVTESLCCIEEIIIVNQLHSWKNVYKTNVYKTKKYTKQIQFKKCVIWIALAVTDLAFWSQTSGPGGGI